MLNFKTNKTNWHSLPFFPTYDQSPAIEIFTSVKALLGVSAVSNREQLPNCFQLSPDFGYVCLISEAMSGDKSNALFSILY